MKPTTKATVSENLTLHRMNHPEDYRLLQAVVTEEGDVIYTFQIKTWPAIKLATKHWWKTIWPVGTSVLVLTAVALLLIIFGG